MELVVRLIVVILYSAWLACTVMRQLKLPVAQNLGSFDVFGLLPRWTFFAPNPGTTDYHLLYRHRDIAGNVSTFTELPLQSRQPWHFLWNPHKRVRKALTDLVIMLNQLCATGACDENNVRVSFSYIALLNFLSGIEMDAQVRSVQFAIFATQGFGNEDQPQPIIYSEFHEI